MAMGGATDGDINDHNNNAYEDARKQRLEANKRRFEDLGISSLSRSLSEVTNSPKKSTQHNQKLKSPRLSTLALDASELRRSLRARNPVSYNEGIVDVPPVRRRSISSSWKSYIARPLNEVKLASYEERAYAAQVAEDFQRNLQSEYPSFVKSMVRSHVYSCFWLGLPQRFCKEHLPSGDLKMVLEDDEGAEYESLFIGSRTGLSGGWRGFALDHKLDDGDALIFELIEPARFKIYIFKARDYTKEGNDLKSDKANAGNSLSSKRVKKLNENGDGNTTKSKKTVKPYSNGDVLDSQKLEQEEGDSTKVGNSCNSKRVQNLNENGDGNTRKLAKNVVTKVTRSTRSSTRSSEVSSHADGLDSQKLQQEGASTKLAKNVVTQVTRTTRSMKVAKNDVSSSPEVKPNGEANDEIKIDILEATKAKKHVKFDLKGEGFASPEVQLDGEPNDETKIDSTESIEAKKNVEVSMNGEDCVPLEHGVTAGPKFRKRCAPTKLFRKKC